MKYNKKYDRWVSKDGLVYRYDSKQDKLVLCKDSKLSKGYISNSTKFVNNKRCVLQHRIVWETFKGVIPDGYEIDHINTIKTDNRLENLRLVTPKENMANPITRTHIQNKRPKSEFGYKFKEHYGFTQSDDAKLYDREKHYFYSHKRCSWETENE